MARRWLGVVGGVIIGAVGSAAFVAATIAEAQPRGGTTGRFQIVPFAGNSTLARLDTATGEVVGCVTTAAIWPDVRCGVTIEALRDLPAR